MPGPASNPLSHLWGSFQAAVNDPVVRSQPGGVQSYVWASVRQDFLSRGDPLPAGSFAAVNELLSLAGQQRRARNELQSASNEVFRSGRDQTLIEGSHTALDIDARFPHGDSRERWRVGFEYSVLVDGQEVMLRGLWDVGPQEKPQSFSDLQAQIEEAAQVQAADYEYEYAGAAALTQITTY